MTAKRSPRYWAQWGRMRHYVANVATTNEIAHHLLDRRIQAVKLQYSLAKKVENERKAGARIRELKAQNEAHAERIARLERTLSHIAYCDTPQHPDQEPTGLWRSHMITMAERTLTGKNDHIPLTDSGRYDG